jgi:hypothetical protein
MGKQKHKIAAVRLFLVICCPLLLVFPYFRQLWREE